MPLYSLARASDPVGKVPYDQAGVNVLITGNHVWRQKEVNSFLATDKRIVPPAARPAGSRGSGVTARPAADTGEVPVINVDTPAPRGHRLASPCDLRRAAVTCASGFWTGRVSRHSLSSLGLVSWDRAPWIVVDRALRLWTVG